MPLVVNTRPPKGSTGKAVNRCYAGPLRDCGGPISAEHPVSKRALRDSISGDKVRMIGNRFADAGPDGKIISIASAAKKVLCARHNSALSTLDGVGAAFTRAHRDLMVHLGNANEGDFHRLFNGYDIERWILKILCATQFGERIPGSNEIGRWEVPKAWLEILFCGAPFPPGAGLYSPKNRVEELRQTVGIGTVRTYFTSRDMDGGLPILGSSAKRLAGLQISIFGVTWELLMERPTDPNEYVYRPRMTRFPDLQSSRVAYLHLGWEEHPPTFKGKHAKTAKNGISIGMVEAVIRIRELQSLRKSKPSH